MNSPTAVARLTASKHAPHRRPPAAPPLRTGRLARPLATLSLLLGAAVAQAAQPGDALLSMGDIPTITVALAEQPAVLEQGRAALYRGLVDQDGIAFVIPELTINTAAAIVLESPDPAAGMTLRLKNALSADWDRTLSSNADGTIDIRFRTEGPAVALLSSDGGMRPYRLAVWVGPELEVHAAAPPPFLSMEEYGRLQGSRWAAPATAIALSVALVLLGLIGLVLARAAGIGRSAPRRRGARA